MNPVQSIAKNARRASIELRQCTHTERSQALENLTKNLLSREKEILSANQKDVAAAQKSRLGAAMIERLTLTSKSLAGIKKAVEEIIRQPEVLGQIVDETIRPNGLKVLRERIPIGVLCMIFESRPNVVIDAAALAIKSGNSIILKGGSEAQYSNQVLVHLVQESYAGVLPKDCVQLVDNREAVDVLITLVDDIDVIIGRGGEKLIRHITQNSKVPVIAHFKGLCHTYVHVDADLEEAREICLNAKISRAGVCNAMESLLLHQGLPDKFIRELLLEFLNAGVELRGCPGSQKFDQRIKCATAEDYHTEYLDKILSVKIVDDHLAAISHIQVHGTQHTEAILARDELVISLFKQMVDASCIVVNASTRFNDGGELGLGAELGISTSKLHAYGPMGAREMTTTRFIVSGNGQIR